MRSALPVDWPGAASSRFVDAGGLCWHVQISGAGPVILLLHGTGASAHSFAPLAALLAKEFRVVAPDLPGQGFTSGANAEHASLEGMSKAVGNLLRELDLSPRLIAGHSAGAAVAASLCLVGACNPAALISINGALMPFGRAAAPVFSRAARVLASLPVFPQLVALHAVPRKPVERMVRQTGSNIPAEMMRGYRELLGRPEHIAGTLRMMANWDLAQLEQNLHRLEPPLFLLYGDRDQVVAPAQARELAQRLPGSVLRDAPGLGHLAHEECPGWFFDEIRAIAGLVAA